MQLNELVLFRNWVTSNFQTSFTKTVLQLPNKTSEDQYNWHPAAAAKSLQSCPTLCDPIDGSPQGSPVPGILQARTLEWVAISFSNEWKGKVKVKSCPTLSDPMDCSLPGSSVHRIFQARVLEWGAMAFSNVSKDPKYVAIDITLGLHSSVP